VNHSQFISHAKITQIQLHNRKDSTVRWSSSPLWNALGRYEVTDIPFPGGLSSIQELQCYQKVGSLRCIVFASIVWSKNWRDHELRSGDLTIQTVYEEEGKRILMKEQL
jgi:hypothetical protein